MFLCFMPDLERRIGSAKFFMRYIFLGIQNWLTACRCSLQPFIHRTRLLAEGIRALYRLRLLLRLYDLIHRLLLPKPQSHDLVKNSLI